MVRKRQKVVPYPRKTLIKVMPHFRQSLHSPHPTTSHVPGRRLPLLVPGCSCLQIITVIDPVPNYSACNRCTHVWAVCLQSLHETGTGKSRTCDLLSHVSLLHSPHKPHSCFTVNYFASVTNLIVGNPQSSQVLELHQSKWQVAEFIVAQV